MKVYAGTDAATPLTAIGGLARRAEAAGFDGIHVSETVHDPFLLALPALQATQRLVVRTSVALAFVRSPLLTAYTAWDLSKLSGGRFQLGLGSQVRQNIEDRYAMPWTAAPATRMREYVEVVRAAFDTFRTGDLVPFHGEHYRFSRMQPYFNPGPDPSTTTPPIYLGGVGPRICEAAGACADGMVTHPTNSDPQYLSTICIPALDTGARESSRTLADFEIVAGLQVITGATDEAVSHERERRRRLFAFLYSTPAYRGALERNGFHGLQDELSELVRGDQWQRLPDIVTDEVLDALVPTARYDELASTIRDHLGSTAHGIAIPLPENPDHDHAMADVVRALQSTPTHRTAPTRRA
ncbi:TIGR03617 family F420-dependent LLM class oxidoreductase [Nocardia sp. NPDC059177]|uniref:TIGR03617 family F420-dependent LLM class oxidoreductase n=1 Tax=Nocardia sp. NPDC059177 TaxID=3346759 RepID=UPI0036AE7A02